jgi:hypothetical protein
MKRLAVISAFGLICVCMAPAGCAAGKLIGGALQNEEYQKLVDTPPKYDRLQNKTIAVLVQADLATLYEHPDLVANITGGVSGRIQRHVPGAQVLDPKFVLNWQYRTPQWTALPFGELTQQLNVERIVHIDLLEYRLNPPGNRWLWEGVCVGRVGLVEREAIDPDVCAEMFDVSAKYPNITGVGRESAPERAIQDGLLYQFIERTAWLFHQHLEPKYPDKYRPELEPKKKKKA